jgi:hypothetical protein
MREPARVDLTDPDQRYHFHAEAVLLLEEIRDLAFDATAKKPQRKHSKAYLRGRLRKRFHKLVLHLGAIDPPAPKGDAVTD